MSGLLETAMEIGLMPAAAYGTTEHPDDRVSMLLLFGSTRDEQRRLHVPVVYQDAMDYLLQGDRLDRLVLPGDDEAPAGIATRISSEYFAFAQVTRMHVLTLGPDFDRALAASQQALFLARIQEAPTATIDKYQQEVNKRALAVDAFSLID